LDLVSIVSAAPLWDGLTRQFQLHLASAAGDQARPPQQLKPKSGFREIQRKHRFINSFGRSPPVNAGKRTGKETL